MMVNTVYLASGILLFAKWWGPFKETKGAVSTTEGSKLVSPVAHNSYSRGGEDNTASNTHWVLGNSASSGAARCLLGRVVVQNTNINIFMGSIFLVYKNAAY